MKFINRLGIFLLGFIMGIVGCIGGLVSGVYYAYTGLDVEDFTGVLTKEDIPILDENSQHNITQMTMEEIVTKFLALYSGDGSLTIANLESTYGLDFSMFKLTEEVRNMPLDKLLKGESEEDTKEFLRYITLGGIAELLSKTFGITFLDENYAQLFSKENGKLYYVTLADLFEEDGYLTALEEVKVFDLIPTKLYEGLPEEAKAALDAVGSISLADLLRAIIKNEGNVAEIIINAEGMQNLMLSDLIPEAGAPLKELLEGISFGDLFKVENGEVKFTSEVLFKNITVYKVLNLCKFFGMTVEEIMAKIPDGEIKDQLNEIMQMSLYELMNSEGIEIYLGDVTFGGVVDFILALVNQEGIIATLPEPIPTVYNKLAPIKLMDAINGLKNGDMTWLLDDALYTLTINDMGGYYVNPLIKEQKLPQPVPVIWERIKGFTFGEIATQPMDTIVNAVFSMTIADFFESYFYEGVYVWDSEGNYVFLYHFDEEGNKVAKMPAPLCAIFDQISKYSIQDIIDAYNCQIGACGHTNPDECFTLIDMLGDSLYNITFGALLDEYVYDENGVSLLPEGLTPIYEAIRNISVGDIVKVISGEESYEVLLKGLYELCIDDIAKYYLDWETLGLPQFVENIYNKIAFIKLGDIINNPMSIVDSLLSLTIDELIGEFISEDMPAAVRIIYNAISNLTLQNIYDAIKDNSWYTLLKGLVDVSIDELLNDVLPEQIPAPLDKIYNSVKDITIGDIIRMILCESGNCDKAEWLYEENPHEYYTLAAILDRTLFTLTIADLLSGLNEETLAKLELFMQTIGTITIGELYRAMEAGFVRNDWTLLASLLEQKCQNATVGALLNPIIEIEIVSKLHPIPFFVKALADEKVSRFINMWKGFDDGYFIIADSEAFFNKMLTGEEVIKVDIDFSKYMDAEHPVSLDFLIGFYIDMLSDELRSYNMDSLTENLFRPFEDITLGDIYRDYKVLLDALTKITVGDVFAEAFGFELNEWGKYYNANVSEVSNEIFNKLAPITIYDLIFGLDKLPEIQNIKLIDIFNLVADIIDKERNEYNQWSKGLRDFVEDIGKYTIGDLYNGRITSENVAIALGEATISDILSVLPQFRAIDNKLVDVLGSIQLVPLLYGDFVKALGTISIGELIEAVAAAFGYEVDVAVELFRKLLRNSKLVLVSQIILVANGEESLENICGTLLKDIYVSDFVEMIYFYTAYADMPEVIKDSELYGILENISIYGLIFDTENELYKLGDTSVADILNLVIDLYEEANDTTVTLPALINKLLNNLDALTARFILEGRTTEEYIKLVLNDISIDDLIGFLCETTGIENVHNELITYEIYNKIGAILLTELIYNPNAALETLKSIGIGDVLQMILNILGVYETLPNTVKKLIVNSAEMNYEYFQDVYTKKIMFTLFVNITIEDITNDIFLILNKEEVIDDEMLAKYYDFAENSILNDFLDTTIYNLIYNPQSLEETFKNTTVGDVVFTIADILIYLGYEDVADYLDQFGSLVKDAVILKLINAEDYVEFMFELFGTSRIIDVINIAEHFGWFFIYDDDDTTDTDIEHIANCFADIQLAAIITNFVPDELFGNYTVGDILAPSAGWTLVTSSKEEGNINALAVVNAPIAGQTWTSGNEQLDEIINTKAADLINNLFSFVEEQYRLPLFFAVGAVAAVILYYTQELTLDEILSSITEVPENIKATKVYKAIACTSLNDFIEGTAQAELYKELTYGDLLDFIIAVIEEITAKEINVADYPELIKKIYDNLGNVKIFGDEYSNIVNDTFNGVTVGDIIECILELAKVDYAVLNDIDLYKKIGNILVLDLINNMDKVIDSLYEVTIGDFIQIILIITKYEPYAELVDFFVNLDNVTIRVLRDAAASGNYETLLKIMFYDTQLTLITNAPFIKDNIAAVIEESKLYNSISEIYVLDLIFFNKEAIVNAIGDATVGEIIALVFDCLNSTIDEKYQVIKKVEENGKTVTIAQIVNNPKENYAVILLTAVTYADIYNDFMMATGIKLELKTESQKLLDKVVLNMRNAYVADLFKSPMYIAVFETIENIILDEIIKVIAENLELTIPEAISGSYLYSKIANISLHDLIFDIDYAIETLKTISIGDFIEIILLLTNYEPYNELVDLFINLDDVTIQVLIDTVASGDYETLIRMIFNNIKLTLITNAPVVKNNVSAVIEESELYNAISEIYVLDLIYFNKEAVVTAIGDVTIGEIIALVFDCLNSTIDEEYQIIKKIEENGNTVTIAQIVNNPDDNYIVILLTAVTYEDIYNDFMMATGIKLELKTESQKLLDKVVLNMRNAYVAELFKSPMYIAVYETIEGIILDEIIKVVAENINITIPEKISNSEVYTKVANISLQELIYDSEAVLEKLTGITVGDIVELTLSLVAENTLTMNSVKKLISNLDAIALKEINKLGEISTWIEVLTGINVEMITLDFQIDNIIDKNVKNPYNVAIKNAIGLFNGIDFGVALNAYLTDNLVNYVFGSMTYGNVFDALLINNNEHTNVVALVYTLKDVRIADGYNGIIENLKTLKFVTVIYAFTDFMPSNIVTVVNAYAALIDTAVIYNVITALRNKYYKAAVNELFADADVGDVYGILKLYKIDVNANATSAYYSKFFEDVTLVTIITDPTPENIFGSMTMDMVIGPMLRWTALSDGHYVAPDKHILKPLENVLVASFLNKNFASLKPYMRTAVAGLIATHAIIFSLIINANMPLINEVLNGTISEAMTKLNLRAGLGRYAIVIDKLVGEAVVADVLRCRSYKQAVITLFDDSTLMDVYDSLYMAGIYNINANETVSYYTHLFADCSIAEMLTDPKPVAFLQDITFGQMFGKFLNWTPANAEKTIWNGTGYFAPIANATLISLINRIPVINKLTPYQQTAVILGAGAVGVGLAYAYQLNAAKINAILNMTVAEYCNRSGINNYINANPTNKLAITMKFVVDNLSTMTIRQLITDISKGYLNNILGDIYIGEIVDLVNALTGIVSKITAKNALYGTLIHNFDNVKLINVLAQKNINGLITVLFSNVTVKDFFQLRYEDSTWRLGRFTVFNALVEKDVDGVMVDVTVAELVRYALAGNYMAIIGNATIEEAYKLIDANETMLASAGVIGTIVYGFLDRNGDWTINETLTNVKNGQFLKLALEGVKVEQLIDIIPAEKLDSLGFIKKALINNKDMNVSELFEGNVVNTLFAGMKIGEIMNYTYDSGKWYMADSSEAGVIESIIADILVTDLIGGSFEIGTAFTGVKLGEIMGYTYDSVTNKWMNGSIELDATTSIIANIDMSDIMDGSMNLGDVFTGTKLGTLMGYSKNASDEWVDETNTALSAIMTMICDQDAGALFKGTVDFEALINDMTLNEVLGLGSSATGIMAKFGALKIGEMNESKFRGIVNDLTIADIFIVGGVDNRAGLMKMLPSDTKISEIGTASKDVIMTATLAELHANGIDIVSWSMIEECAPKLGLTTAQIGALTLEEFMTALINKVVHG